MSETHNIPLQLEDKFQAAFPDHHIPNGVIDKTKTRLGITYSAFHAKRHSLTVVSGVPIIDSAIIDYPELGLFPVHDGVTWEHVRNYLLTDNTYIRIVTTPESFGKIIRAAASIDKLNWMYKDVFLYMDEMHCYAVDKFRKDILTPFKWVYKFKNVAFGSATPFKSCDPKIAEMQHYKITYEEKFGTISILDHHDPMAALHYILTHPDMFSGGLHIFLNTVMGGGEAIMRAGLTPDNTNVYCRNDERNEINLGEARACFRERPVEGEYKKFNFYSCRYNEGWNLKADDTATILLVTDVHIPHSVVGIEFKGYQAMGRLNYTNIKRIHITNNYNQETMKTFDTVQRNDVYNASKYVPMYNKYLQDCRQDGMEDDERLKNAIKDFVTFEDDGTAVIDHQKLDQVTYENYFREPYSNKNTIAKAWQSQNYDTGFIKFDIDPIERKSKSAQEINRQVVTRFLEYKEHPEQYIYAAATETMKQYKVEFELLFQAIEILGPEEIERLEYDNKAMKDALINTSNKNAEAKLRLRLLEELKVGGKYTKKEIKVLLQCLYNELQIRKPDGSIKTAKATDLLTFGLFEIGECKMPSDKKSKPDNGYEIIKVTCTIKRAA